MRVEVKRVDVERLALAREHDEDHLNGEQALAVVELLVGNQAVEHLHEIGEEVDVDGMREPEKWKTKRRDYNR